jgi:hypothetical protein
MARILGVSVLLVGLLILGFACVAVVHLKQVGVAPNPAAFTRYWELRLLSYDFLNAPPGTAIDLASLLNTLYTRIFFASGLGIVFVLIGGLLWLSHSQADDANR